MPHDSRGFFEAIVGDGRPLIVLTALCLALSGVFALFQSATGHFLPHECPLDVAHEIAALDASVDR